MPGTAASGGISFGAGLEPGREFGLAGVEDRAEAGEVFGHAPRQKGPRAAQVDIRQPVEHSGDGRPADGQLIGDHRGDTQFAQFADHGREFP